MIYGYIRVSTDKQTIENQRYEINQFCQKHIMVVDKWIEETISGTKKVEERELGKLLEKNGRGRYSNLFRTIKIRSKFTNDYGGFERMYE